MTIVNISDRLLSYTRKRTVLEIAGVNEYDIEMTAMDKFFVCMKFVHKPGGKVLKDIGLLISLALSNNKILSKIANNECRPNSNSL